MWFWNGVRSQICLRILYEKLYMLIYAEVATVQIFKVIGYRTYLR
jgi:hypothetical protein